MRNSIPYCSFLKFPKHRRWCSGQAGHFLSSHSTRRNAQTHRHRKRRSLAYNWGRNVISIKRRVFGRNWRTSETLLDITKGRKRRESNSRPAFSHAPADDRHWIRLNWSVLGRFFVCRSAVYVEPSIGSFHVPTHFLHSHQESHGH